MLDVTLFEELIRATSQSKVAFAKTTFYRYFSLDPICGAYVFFQARILRCVVFHLFRAAEPNLDLAIYPFGRIARQEVDACSR